VRQANFGIAPLACYQLFVDPIADQGVGKAHT
jgi:hypothetical protein